jgi:hypothetical protein
MGLHRIPVRQTAIPLIPDTMRALGLPITRTGQDAQGVHYFFAHPKRNIELKFWLTGGTSGNPCFLMMGLSGVSKRVLTAFGNAGILEQPFAEPATAPNGSPGTPSGNSGATEGPPSVS